MASLVVIGLPEVSLPELSLPELSLLSAGLPEVSLPELSLPELSLPELSLPEVGLPEVGLLVAGLLLGFFSVWVRVFVGILLECGRASAFGGAITVATARLLMCIAGAFSLVEQIANLVFQ